MTSKTRLTAGLTWALALAALAVTACGEREPQQEMPDVNVLQEVAIFPLSVLISTSGTREAMQTTFVSGYPKDTVAAWYRRGLNSAGWRIVGDVVDPAGQITLHAEREGPPLWIIIEDRVSPPGTKYTLIGAVPDTTGSRP